MKSRYEYAEQHYSNNSWRLLTIQKWSILTTPLSSPEHGFSVPLVAVRWAYIMNLADSTARVGTMQMQPPLPTTLHHTIIVLIIIT